MAWWAHPDLNREPSGYEPVALPIELCALNKGLLGAQNPKSPEPQDYCFLRFALRMSYFIFLMASFA